MLFTKGNKNTTKHYYPATLLKLYLSLSLLFYGSSSVQMLLIPSYTNVAQHTHSCILTAHLLIDFWMVFELKTSIRQGCLSGSLIRVYKSRNLVGVEFRNLRSGPILAVLIHSPWRLPLKSGLIQTLTSLYSLRPDFGHNADWLLEQRHRIWLAVEINRSWKSSFLAWLFLRMISHGQREGSILLSFFVLFFLIVGKYAWICAKEIQKIHIFSGFALFMELKWVYRRVESLCKLLTLNNVLNVQITRVQIKILSILKLVSFESLAGNDFSEWGT